MTGDSSIDVYLGLDVGKGEHHATALTPAQLIDVGDGSAFTTAGHLAAYAGLAPVTRTSGSSIRGQHPARRGNEQLKRAFCLAAFASLSQPESRACYDRKRREGSTTSQP